ncbi:ImmA/IrrE family metallo-endopeptidase [Rugamonas sp.]|uniref:ImmA/IrrE family metallo-endopeptidase n=1 Tax=Rugamonas sp. TaxID=1926287 RepID=UPI0025F5BC17|nr:XRE family transcriptional regulator [Rugamonas sp.]
MTLHMPQINPSGLRWARETAGLSLDTAARALHLGGKRQSPEDCLRQYEDGVAAPSRPLILKMAKTYHRPLLAFYLPEPPRKGERGEDFRTVPLERRAESAGPLDALVRDVYVRQRLVRTTLEDAEEAVRLPFVGSVGIDQDVATVAGLLARQLHFDLRVFRAQRSVEEAFRYLRAQVERSGVFVLLIGNLGSHHSNVGVDVFRGFALADDVAPFIVINDQDAKPAWSFTMLHELAHIWLGRTGVSAGALDQRVEKFCNDVASQLLMPDAELGQWQFDAVAVDDIAREIQTYAEQRKISRSMVAYRLLRAGRLSHTAWHTLTERFYAEWIAGKAADKKSAMGGGPSYYVVRRHHLGQALLDLVKRTLAEGILTPTKAGRVLGVRPVNVATLMENA